ncbi:hypothetical protein EV652_122108 [Kribbella steppae]|uniref:Uncharacterized protein n=1 Tax=Kribbella steppae TaxID=2512223 RepID=A0A4R2GWQ1_9ACTN|nr:hypothetical protein EV652_122108 [Kribbella steppae]
MPRRESSLTQLVSALRPIQRTDGFLGYVQKVGDRPESSQSVNYESTADFGVGAFLLAGAELTTTAAPAAFSAPGSPARRSGRPLRPAGRPQW